MIVKIKTILAVLCLVTLSAGNAADKTCAADDFPTAVIADYVLGCMAANGNSFASLHQCSCSIDFIKSRMSYRDFEEANTILQVQRDRGQRGIFYREANWAKERVAQLEKYQAESTLRCF